MTQSPIGGSAQTTYRVTSRQGVIGREAQRVFVVTDGRAAEGGPSQAVYYVSEAEIAAGEFVISGNKPIPISAVGATGAEYPPIAVYVVDANSASDFPPSAPEPSGDAPLFQSSEIGTVDASTLVVAFDRDVSAADYGAGATIRVNGLATSITSATRQANHAIVHYIIPVLWHGSGDAVTWEYSEVGGNIVSEADSTPLTDVTAQSATNNCEYSTVDGVDLQADTQSLGALATWADETPGSSRVFAQATGSAQPVVQDIGGYRAVMFDDTDDEMTAGDNFGDDLVSFAVIFVATPGSLAPYIFDKNSAGQGWDVTTSDTFFAQNAEQVPAIGTAYNGPEIPFSLGKKVRSMIKPSNIDLEYYFNGVEESDLYPTEDPVTTFTNETHLTINKYPVENGLEIYGVLLLVPVPSATNRAALEARLAARYGVTL